MLSRKVAAMLVVSSSRCLAIAEPPFRARRGSIRVLPFGLSSTGRTTRRLVAHRAPRAGVGGAMVTIVTMADGRSCPGARCGSWPRSMPSPNASADKSGLWGFNLWDFNLWGSSATIGPQAQARRAAVSMRHRMLNHAPMPNHLEERVPLLARGARPAHEARSLWCPRRPRRWSCHRRQRQRQRPPALPRG